MKSQRTFYFTARMTRLHEWPEPRRLVGACGNEAGIEEFIFAVDQWSTIKIEDATARGAQHCIACCGVPLHGGGGPGIPVGISARHEHEFQRGTDRHPVLDASIGEPSLRFR